VPSQPDKGEIDISGRKRQNPIEELTSCNQGREASLALQRLEGLRISLMSTGFNHEMLANSHTALFESNTKELLNGESTLQNASEKACHPLGYAKITKHLPTNSSWPYMEL